MMSAWKSLLLATSIVLSGFVGCTITSGDGDGDDDEDVVIRGGSTGSGTERGGQSAVGGNTVSEGTGGSTTVIDFTEADCEGLAADEPSDSCTECIYENLCALSVECLNTEGCMDAVIDAANCIYDAWVVNDEDTADIPDDGFVTSAQEDTCVIDANLVEVNGNDLWAAMAGRDESQSTACAYPCYLTDVLH